MNYKISITKMGGVIASLISALAFASPAQAFTLNWSFDATGGTTLGTVSGTISGLQDNTVNTSGLTATVLVTPDGQYQGLNFNSLTSGSITVASGVVTSAHLQFTGSDRAAPEYFGDELYFSTNYPNYYPLYYIYRSPAYQIFNVTSLPTDPTITGVTTFSSATPVPFDFDPSFGVVALGGIWAGRKVIKKIKTSKKSV
jgi:hypothetical protein